MVFTGGVARIGGMDKALEAALGQPMTIPEHPEFTGARGSLYIDPIRLDITRLDVSVPVANVYTTSKLLDAELAGADWLDSARHPTLALRTTSVLAQGDGVLNVIGDMSMHGVTRPVTLDVTFHGAGINPVKDIYTIGFDVRGRILRSDFGVTSHLPLIGDELELIISASFELEGAMPEALGTEDRGETT